MVYQLSFKVTPGSKFQLTLGNLPPNLITPWWEILPNVGVFSSSSGSPTHE